MKRAGKKMYESEAKRKWQKENTVMIPVKLQKSTDADILAYLEGKSKQTIIKIALREHMQIEKIMQEQEGEEQ